MGTVPPGRPSRTRSPAGGARRLRRRDRGTRGRWLPREGPVKVGGIRGGSGVAAGGGRVLTSSADDLAAGGLGATGLGAAGFDADGPRLPALAVLVGEFLEIAGQAADGPGADLGTL